MNDSKTVLSPAAVEACELADWRHLRDVLKARFTLPDYRSALDLVTRIGHAAEAADHHPVMTVTSSEVMVTLTSHDVGGVTMRDCDMARIVSSLAHQVGAVSDVTGLTILEIGLDTADGSRHGPMYAALLGSDLVGGEPVDPSGQVPTIWWQEPRSPDATSSGRAPLPAQDVEQRWHFDVWVPADDVGRRLQAVIAAGGTLVSDAAAPSFWVVEDADGNRSCLCAVTGR
ncbi:4a-hydroxytetrahydrobiopterin dehydratase [Austwickia sp. TVS 96-490-7B]|uniref:4a-hydroxytetrahydrobiopterin dehydratase n=1 Tax=Austwickia sp. TVS 96-490-7B TaxID=2830843 RepID=UPI002102DE8C|nr:4a-hydroxytetrahydrobiopterin dehydratase [Austwickia sp. TVS 96-490-7B]